MDKVIERIVALLPVPILVAVAIVFVAAWGIKVTQGFQGFSQVLGNATFHIVALFACLALGGYYGSVWILRAASFIAFSNVET